MNSQQFTFYLTASKDQIIDWTGDNWKQWHSSLEQNLSTYQSFLRCFSPRFGELAVCFPPRSLKKPRPKEARIFLEPKLSSAALFALVGEEILLLGYRCKKKKKNIQKRIKMRNQNQLFCPCLIILFSLIYYSWCCRCTFFIFCAAALTSQFPISRTNKGLPYVMKQCSIKTRPLGVRHGLGHVLPALCCWSSCSLLPGGRLKIWNNLKAPESESMLTKLIYDSSKIIISHKLLAGNKGTKRHRHPSSLYPPEVCLLSAGETSVKKTCCFSHRKPSLTNVSPR